MQPFVVCDNPLLHICNSFLYTIVHLEVHLEDDGKQWETSYSFISNIDS